MKIADDAPDLIVEEKIVPRVRVEEMRTLSDNETVGRGDGETLRQRDDETVGRRDAEKRLAASPNVSLSHRLIVPLSIFFLFAIVAVIVYQNYFRRGEARVILTGSPIPFSGAAGRENTPSFSPDGKSLAFVRVFGSTNQDLFIAPTTGDAAPRQITFDKKTIHSLAWSLVEIK